MDNIKIQLAIHDSALNGQTFVSNEYHIFKNNVSLCSKWSQDTYFYETDLTPDRENVMLKNYDEILSLIEENKTKICSKCYKKFLTYLNNKNITKTNNETVN